MAKPYVVPRVRREEPSCPSSLTPYDKLLAKACQLNERPFLGDGPQAIARQHSKNRMTIWERIRYLCGDQATILYKNWGPNLDGASLVTAIAKINNRDVAIYGHDFTTRAGSMDASNGQKLARLFSMAGERGIPLVGINDSAGAYVPAGVGGLDGYASAFYALRQLSGVVPSIMCMFGYNAGGGAYLPRQGSFVIQPQNSFVGLTGPSVVQSVLGESISADKLGGPSVHGQTGVADYIASDEVAALNCVKLLLQYIPDNNRSHAPFLMTSDPIDRSTEGLDQLLRGVINSTNSFNTPFDVKLILQQLCDFGDFFEFQPQRAANSICAFGRLGGYVTGLIANNSAVCSGQIDIDAAYKKARFIRFCNLYNIPMVFVQDTTGFVPGSEQEQKGIVQAGRAMLDSIIDIRTPSILLIVRNAYGGAYASFNCYNLGADIVMALPTTRLAVMGNAGKRFVYKNELKALADGKNEWIKQRSDQLVRKKYSQKEADQIAIEQHEVYVQEMNKTLDDRYERDFLNPNEALSLGSISHLVMPVDVRREIVSKLCFLMNNYTPSPLKSQQREFY